MSLTELEICEHGGKGKNCYLIHLIYLNQCFLGLVYTCSVLIASYWTFKCRKHILPAVIINIYKREGGLIFDSTKIHFLQIWIFFNLYISVLHIHTSYSKLQWIPWIMTVEVFKSSQWAHEVKLFQIYFLILFLFIVPYGQFRTKILSDDII